VNRWEAAKKQSRKKWTDGRQLKKQSRKKGTYRKLRNKAEKSAEIGDS
jgi:hypothetical protein